ncbi:E3 ubiquitin-protein ligase ZSWIM2-like isoform X1 [Octopus sinensis]|uniref:E3 ubiquitin-protein ligase ZSWIM2-like isoform X1 n=1 Tax=Octopus sinensis TaxID=2607531 RepID=A0A6P7TVD4_9MOLL|nr:E3 ubiquitin-protein ligase ZSWIM2-like isoform X1 [Octopus sinensis]XP_036370556.1 E3 ubiquitin-protein ligase ZSWIM2-like isoform X1 [Octopus sinensis]
MNSEECYQKTCSEVVNSNQLLSLSAKIYILRTFGPLAFLLKEDGEEKNFKTFLGRKHCCSCSLFLRTKELCRHICWLLLKKFRLTMKDPLSWQKGLSEREIDDLLAKSASDAAANKTQTNTEQSAESVPPADGAELNTVPQRKIDEDSVCPICLDNLLKSHLPVTYCRYGCGNNIHIKCMKIHAEHQTTTGSEEKDTVMCPMCRGVFVSLEKLKIEERNSMSGVAFPVKHYHYGLECSTCHLKPIIGNCYKCTICNSFYLCQHCFNTSVHEEHQFKFRQRRTQRWKMVERSFNYSLPEALIKNLMRRDLKDDDYESLLQLDSDEFTQFNSLSEKIIESLPLETVTENSVLLSTGAQCHICLGPFQVSTLVRRLPYRHKFHRECIDNWLLHSRSVCPIDGTNAWNANAVFKKNNQKCQSKKKEPPTEELSLNISGLAIYPESQHKLGLGKTKKTVTTATKSLKASDTDSDLSLAGMTIKSANRNSSPNQKSSGNSDKLLNAANGDACPSNRKPNSAMSSRRRSLVLPPLRVRKKILRHSANSVSNSDKNSGNNGISKILQPFCHLVLTDKAEPETENIRLRSNLLEGQYVDELRRSPLEDKTAKSQKKQLIKDEDLHLQGSGVSCLL